MSIKLSEAFQQFLDKVDEVHAAEVHAVEQGISTWDHRISQMIPGQVLSALEQLYQKIEIRYDETSYSYSVRLWYDGKGMLPPNIEIYRVPTEDAAIKAAFLAAQAAFPEGIDDDSE